MLKKFPLRISELPGLPRFTWSYVKAFRLYVINPNATTLTDIALRAAPYKMVQLDTDVVELKTNAIIHNNIMRWLIFITHVVRRYQVSSHFEPWYKALR